VVASYEVKFKDRIEEYGQLISNLKNVAIWGAGAKGSTFLNLLDKHNEKVKCVIDINPKKQHQYIGGTGHYIIKPNELADQAVENVIVMNVNYIDEIKAITDPLNIKLITL
jgi:FlaA1/EpsC-like NDP-sugar epimerase